MAENKILFALDVATGEEALALVNELKGEVGGFKIGLQLFTSAGASFVRQAVESGHRVFLDVKFHDIPNTVAASAVEVSRLGVWMFNIHIAGGKEMIRKTVCEVHRFCDESGIKAPKILGVTVLTSTDAATLLELGNNSDPRDLVVKYALIAEECGLDGVVASPLEVAAIRNAVSKKGFLVVTPGIRPAFATNNDQKRVTTPETAIKNGADYLVIGRPIRDAVDRVGAARRILEEIS